jgi:hypothetical protein
MPAAPTPIKIARKAISRLNRLRRDLSPISSETSVHQFRVQFKKTRALFRMANAMDEEDNHRIKKTWKKIYAATGALRDAVIIIHLLEKEFEDDSLVNYQRKKKDELEQILQGELKNGRPFRLSDRKWNKFTAVALNAYFTQLLQPITNSFGLPIADRQLHEIRKNLKDFLYNLQWLDAMDILYPPVVAHINIAAVEHLLLLLGNYQNEVVQSAALRRFKQEPELHHSVISIDDYLHHLAQEQVRQHNEILQALQHTFHLHTA